ncbi:MAG TPA: hypothetical protein VFZ65_03905 [Planctomycetota bacterium]|nr:hypothetical protein [Planctomycetota bacterium]
MMPAKSPFPTFLFALLPWVLGVAAAAQNKPGYDEALARYRVCMGRAAFKWHTEGRDRLAQTRSPDALAILAEDYDKTKDYPEYARYTMATLFGRHFDDAQAVETFRALRKANSKPVDTWLWVRTLRIEADRVGDAALVSIVQEDKNATHRAAAIAAIGESKSGNLAAVIVPTCVEFPKKESDRMVLLGAMSGALFDNRRLVNDAKYRDALTAYIGLLGDDVGLSHTAKVQVARHLQWILKGPALFINPEPWLELLQRGEIKEPKKNDTRAAPRFFGIETEGERFCYVVDMSDSMCKDISPSARPPLAAVTGPRPKKKKDALLDESDLPWNKIKSRWDLAREQLRISLSRLTPDKHFAIVWFGDESGTLDSCKGMIKATKANIARVMAELDSIKPLSPEQFSPEDRVKAPDGKLRGRTNMHSGLRRAFGLAGKGFVEECGYVDPDALTEGCDTMFLLSDGSPSWDDFHLEETNYLEGNAVLTTEYNTPMPQPKRIVYHGPYSQDDNWLVEDLRRMNAFRRIRMHCIGLGEANMDLLRRLAEMGHGEVFSVGDKK